MGNLSVEETVRKLVQSARTQLDIALAMLQPQIEEPPKPSGAWFGADDTPPEKADGTA